MNYMDILKRAGSIVWRHPALWIAGALLALTTANSFAWPYGLNQETVVVDNTVRITDTLIVRFPGQGISIDLAAPGRPSVRIDGRGLADLQTELRLELGLDLWPVLVTAGMVLGSLIVLGTLVHYLADTAVIRSVHHIEQTGERVGVRQTVRLGWSRYAGRLFLIDLAIWLPVGLGLALLFGLALAALLAWGSADLVVRIAGTVFSTGLLVLFGLLSLVACLLLSLLMPVFHRACAVEELGVRAAIRQGLRLVWERLAQTTGVWILWGGLRLAWALALGPAAILVSPLILLGIVLGTVSGSMLAVMVCAAARPFFAGITPWVMGIVAGTPLLILATIVPLVFLGGLVEIFTSAVWTLAYRDLRHLSRRVTQPAVQPSELKLGPVPS